MTDILEPVVVPHHVPGLASGAGDPWAKGMAPSVDRSSGTPWEEEMEGEGGQREFGDSTGTQVSSPTDTAAEERAEGE